MKVNHYEEVESQTVEMEGAVGCKVRWLVGESDGAPTIAMRQLSIVIKSMDVLTPVDELVKARALELGFVSCPALITHL